MLGETAKRVIRASRGRGRTSRGRGRTSRGRGRTSRGRGRASAERGQASAERGQASAEFVAVVPLIVVLVLVIAQTTLAGYALWSAGAAARAGARAEHVGGDPRAAARSALPVPLRAGAKIKTGGLIEVAVAAPVLVPGVPALEVRARTALDPEAGDG